MNIYIKKTTSNNTKAFVQILVNFFNCAAISDSHLLFKAFVHILLNFFSCAQILYLNFQANHVRAQLKKFIKMWTKAFALLEVFFFFKYLFTHCWQKCLVDVILYSLDSFETHLFGFQLYGTLWTANNASLFCFNFYWQWLSQCSICLCFWPADNAALLCFSPYFCRLSCHVLFCGEDINLPSVCL